MEEILVPITLFAIIPVTVWAVSHYRYKTRNRMADVLQQYAVSDKEPPQDLIKAIGLPRRQPHTDLRRGMLAIAIGLAFFIMGSVIPDEEATVIFAGFASFPILIGIALLLFWYFVGRKTEDA
ncbi:DUF6249 domain-containing protein [Robiginitomaculum antarcticum]|uniref:DUF6249 domain-containing protein n=1 Tax=Robiginitomaculum antarcticum TaxID=437507 RepID=UPI000365C03E|nr:DUF6249 domain-containing protein [Robiginitomaculum antarcticum]